MLLAVIRAEVDDLVLGRLPAQFAEEEIGAERARKNADELSELIAERRIAEGDAGRGVLLVAFERTEEIQLVLDDRAADRRARLPARIAGVRRQ